MNLVCQNVRRLALCAGALAVALVLTGCPEPGGDIVETLDVVYGVGNVSNGGTNPVYTTKDLLLDVYEPLAGGSDLPAVIIMHGGGWFEGDKQDERQVFYGRFLADRGYVCFVINYRLAGDYPPAPDSWDAGTFAPAAHASFVDLKAAIRFVRANAATYNVDPDKIALMGDSAGAIAGVTAVLTDDDEYVSDGDAFPIPASNNPGVPTDIAAYVHLWGYADHVLLRVNASTPPTMIVHGTDDDIPLTPFGGAERFHFMLELWDVPHEFYAAEDMGHGAWNYTLRGRELEYLVYDFLQEQLLGIGKEEAGEALAE
jgi:acetyl esterase/lipase